MKNLILKNVILLSSLTILNAQINSNNLIDNFIGTKAGTILEVKYLDDNLITKHHETKNKFNKDFYVKLNGIYHFMSIYGMNRNNPVLLYIHGGPGNSSIPKQEHLKALESIYTIVHYDQRGTGKTQEKNEAENIIIIPNIQDMMQDIKEIVQYLKSYFNKDKIALLGHSFGSILGSEYALKYPKDVLFYVGVGQVVDLLKQEEEVYKYLYSVVQQNVNKEDLNKLDKISNYPYLNNTEDLTKSLITVRTLQSKYKVINIDISDDPKVQEKLQKNVDNYREVYENIREFSLLSRTQYKTNIFYVLGDNDYWVPTNSAILYFHEINAPLKRLFVIPNAGHVTMTDNFRGFFNAMHEIYKTIK